MSREVCWLTMPMLTTLSVNLKEGGGEVTSVFTKKD